MKIIKKKLLVNRDLKFDQDRDRDRDRNFRDRGHALNTIRMAYCNYQPFLSFL